MSSVGRLLTWLLPLLLPLLLALLLPSLFPERSATRNDSTRLDSRRRTKQRLKKKEKKHQLSNSPTYPHPHPPPWLLLLILFSLFLLPRLLSCGLLCPVRPVDFLLSVLCVAQCSTPNRLGSRCVSSRSTYHPTHTHTH